MAETIGACVLIPGIFGLFLQGLLGCTSMSILAVKYYYEFPRRRWSNYLRDVSKQLGSALEVHLLNLTFAGFIANRFVGGSADSCDWYWLSILIDTTFGVFLNFVLLQFTQRTFGYVSGNYSSRQGAPYFIQLVIWMGIALVMKICMISFLLLFHTFFLEAASLILGPLNLYSRAKLVVVMIFTPVMMNMFNYWVTDQFLRGTVASHHFRLPAFGVRKSSLSEGARGDKRGMSETSTSCGGESVDGFVNYNCDDALSCESHLLGTLSGKIGKIHSETFSENRLPSDERKGSEMGRILTSNHIH